MAKKWTRENVLAGVALPGKIDDLPEMKEELIGVFLTKTHREISRYGELLAGHILNLRGIPREGVLTEPALAEAAEINAKWREGEATFQDARNVAGKLLDLAREETDHQKETVLRTLAQVANIPHVARHALIASDYAVRLINLLCPDDQEAVKKERQLQIDLMKNP